jgi:hypothetical protein
VESPVRTSFIPKQAVQAPLTRRTQPVISIFTVIGIFVFLSAIVACGAVFLYKTYLITELEKQDALLKSKEEELNIPVLEEWTALDKRINIAKELLAKHVAPSLIFKHIEDNTLTSIRFTDFSLQKSADKDVASGDLKLALSGEASRISSIVLQSESFGAQKVFKNPIFREVSGDGKGLFTFRVETAIARNDLMYSNKFDLTEAPPEPAIEESLIEESQSLDGELNDQGVLDDNTL